jgi:hypothetical protein
MMGKKIQKAAIILAIGGLALALLGIVLIQSGPRSLELVFSGVHTAGKIVIFAGLAIFLLASVLGRYVAKWQRWTGWRPRAPANWRNSWLRATLASAVSASFFAIWMWPIEAVLPGSLLLLTLYFGHWLSLAAFVVAGVGFVITSAAKTLVMPTPSLPAMSNQSSLANSSGGSSDHPLD